MRLFLIRHAQSKHAHTDIVAGPRGCPGLTPHGIEQAHRLADRVRAAGLFHDSAVVLASPALRARQTAEILLPALPIQSLILDENLFEQLPGQADGMTHQAYHAAYGKFSPPEQPDRPYAPGGESWNQFINRASGMPLKIASQYPDQTVVAVTHAGFIVVTFLALFGVPLHKNRARIDPDFTGITEWEYQDSTWRLIRYNDITHLQP